ncbi:NEDD8-activating enzyme E1 catalytic subunit-like [Bolinopsis microptera]|uniref:NEDD8-activating enzyme E1 catalytic subunit-like n=1 Tax=Bolinopsis microptera TaxID=2820187 RepID=UPI00307A2564
MVPMVQEHVKILVVGAGGLGCEIIKCLAMTGFRDVHVIDMDTIDLSNLNRQFLFTPQDIGKPKAEAAVRAVMERIPGLKYTAHYNKIQDFDDDFYLKFNIVICGLDSVFARRWINSTLMNIALQTDNIIPFLDGGTEAFKGHCRVVIPTKTACIECNMDLYPPQQNFPLCTIANTPRLPEHCVEYAKIVLWPKEQPFGQGVVVDGDNPDHITWLYKTAVDRAKSYNIPGVTYRLTQGVTKRIIPAVASTNATIAAACVTECLKIATSSYNYLDNYMMFNNVDSIYTFTFASERKENCLACSRCSHDLAFFESDKLQVFLDKIGEETEFNLQKPTLTTISSSGENRTLYMSNLASMEEALRPNLEKTFKELEFESGQEVVVTDPGVKMPVHFKLRLT